MVANEWKDANDKVMPVKQWLEERRFLQVYRQFSLHFCTMFLCAILRLDTSLLGYSCNNYTRLTG